jgi:Fic family protein
MPFDPAKPYDDLPALPPPGELESKAVLKACIEARVALSALHQATALVPNPSVFINSIPLLEAQASSEIENIVTTTDELFRHTQLNLTAASAATKEALRYGTALRAGFESLKRRPLCTGTAEEVCTTIKDVQMSVRRVPGTALRNDTTGETIYTPPVGEGLLREKLANWERFLHGGADIDPLVRMAIAHYQFEAIHPFTDGNGRTGRVLNLLFLADRGLLQLPVLYLSRYIIRNKGDYYRLLLDVTRGSAWEPWTLYMLRAIAETSKWTLDKIEASRHLMDQTAALIKEKLPKIYSRELIDIIFTQPYARIENLIEAGIGKRQTASTYLKSLTSLDVLEERTYGRDKLFVNTSFVRLLTSDNDVPQRTTVTRPAAETGA